jgi:5-methylcytosine-specific restriction endonuclease McrA
MKQCSSCKQIKPFDCFGKDRRSKTGFRSQCKDCERKYEKSRDPEKKRAHAKKYREAHKETEKARYQNWKENNPQKYNAHRKRMKVNRRRVVLEYDKDITIEVLYNRAAGICALCGGRCDYEDYVFRGETFIAGNHYPSIDHIVPISKGGSHTWDNVQLAHKQCNSIKSDKTL